MLGKNLSEGRLEVTKAFDCFWEYASERQQIYLRRLAGLAPPWTDDPILAEYRFTNVYRASDRVSQYLINQVQSKGDSSWKEVFTRTLVFKLFNRISTWELLKENLNAITSEMVLKRRLEPVLAQASERKLAIYNPAYIMPPPQDFNGPKFARHLKLVRILIRDKTHLKIQKAKNLQEAFKILRSYSSFGDFLAYQLIIDLNYSRHLRFQESEFVVAGPGARRGIQKTFLSRAGLSDSQLILWTAKRQDKEFERRELAWSRINNRPLQLIDIQNIFCELDKYTRLALPDLSVGVAGKRPKQRYKPIPLKITARFPSKWKEERTNI